MVAVPLPGAKGFVDACAGRGGVEDGDVSSLSRKAELLSAATAGPPPHPNPQPHPPCEAVTDALSKDTLWRAACAAS